MFSYICRFSILVSIPGLGPIPVGIGIVAAIPTPIPELELKLFKFTGIGIDIFSNDRNWNCNFQKLPELVVELELKFILYMISTELCPINKT